MSLVTAPERAQLCTFVAGHLRLALPVEDVSEVLHAQEVTPVPLAPPAVIGLLNLRGRIVTAVDARVRFGLPPRALDDATAHVVVWVLDEQISLVVDGTSDVVTVSAAEREDVPETIDADIRQLLTAAYQQADALLLVVDPALVLSPV
jgi:purine-binding chemotaxis protein CheW